MSETLLKGPERATRSFHEPLRPSDGKWRSRNGDLREDLGKYFELVDKRYVSTSKPAVQCQEDGSGIARYPSGNNAVVTSTHHRSRRVSVVLFADQGFKPVTAGRAPTGARIAKKPVTVLGTIDEWGVGYVECPPNPQASVQPSYSISAKSVAVTDSKGVCTRVHFGLPSSSKLLKESEHSLKLRLTENLVIRFDAERGLTAIDFSVGSENIQHTFLVGEVHRVKEKERIMQGTTPAKIFDKISFHDDSVDDMRLVTGNVGSVHTRLPVKADVDGLLGTLRTTEKNQDGFRKALTIDKAMSHTLKPGASSSAPDLGRLMDATLSKPLLNSGPALDYTFQHKLVASCRDMHAPLTRQAVKGPMGKPTGVKYWSGKCTDSCHFDQLLKIPDKALTKGTPAWDKPVQVKQVSASKLQEIVESAIADPVLVVAFVIATWAAKSSNNSSAHAEGMAKAVAAQYARRGSLPHVKVVMLDVTEAGGIYSDRRFTHPVVKQFGIKDVPWLLMFARGRNIFSEHPGQPVHWPSEWAQTKSNSASWEVEKVETMLEKGKGHDGFGFVHRLRYPTLAKPRFLVLELLHAKADEESLEPIMTYSNQLQTQEVLKRCHYQFDLAVSEEDAHRMAAEASPPYGAFIASTTAGAPVVQHMVRVLQKRNKNVLSFMVHDWKAIPEPNDEIRRLARDKYQIMFVFSRPLTKSQLDRELGKHSEAMTKYPEAGTRKDHLVTLIDSVATREGLRGGAKRSSTMDAPDDSGGGGGGTDD